MKRYFAFFLCAVLVLGLAACRGGKVDPTTPAPTETAPAPTETTAPAPTETEDTEPTDPAPTEPEPEADSLVALTLTPNQDILYSEDGETVVFSFSIQHPAVTIPAAPQAAAKIDSALGIYTTQAESTVQSYKEMAAYDFKNGSMMGAYELRVRFVPARVDEAILSLSVNEASYLGGAHPNSIVSAMSFSTVTGERLALLDILADEASLETLGNMLLERLDELNGESHMLYDGYEEAALTHVNGANEDGWLLTPEGLEFCYSTYEIAPYMAGPVSVTIGYDELEGILADAYFPESSADGNVVSELVSQHDMNALRNILPLTLDAEGEQFVVTTDTELSNVKVLFHTYYGDGDYCEDTVLFAANRLTDTDCVLISAYLPDGMPNLGITSDSGDYDIFQSGEDGSIVLCVK